MSERRLALATAVLSLLGATHAAEVPALRHDPFARPTLAASAPSAAASAAQPEPLWQPVLSAVMVAGDKSLVNVDGFVVQVGQEINGYRLVQVTETGAVLVKKKQRLELKLAAPSRAPKS